MRIKKSKEKFPHGRKFKSKPNWIVIHYTGVACASANNVCKSLTEERQKDRAAKSSTHFVVDEIETIACVPLDTIAWHVGDGKVLQPDWNHLKTLEELKGLYSKDRRYDLAATNHLRWIAEGEDFKGNSVSIGVDLCTKKGDSKNTSVCCTDWSITDETFDNGAKLVAWLMKEYDIGIERVIRHADATGKCCPRPFVSLPNDNVFPFADGVWELFRQRVLAYNKQGIDAEWV